MARLPSLHRSLRGAMIAAAFALMAALLPATVAAQVCFGSPNAPGQFSMQGDVTFMDQATGYMVSSLANIDGPWAIGATLGTISPDEGESRTVAAARGLYGLAFDLLDLCPVAEVEWTTSTQAGVDVDTWAFPLGVSAGLLFPLSPTIELIPSGRLGLRHARMSVGDETFTDSDLFLDAGATLSLVPFFVRGGFGWIAGDDSDTSFRLSVGVTF